MKEFLRKNKFLLVIILLLIVVVFLLTFIFSLKKDVKNYEKQVFDFKEKDQKVENKEDNGKIKLGNGFYKKEDGVYFDTGDYGIIGSKDVDVETFENIGGGFNKDKNSIYCFFDKIDSIIFDKTDIADKETFEVLEKSAFAKDKDSYYRCYLGTSEGVVSQILKQPDGDSFQDLGYDYSKDKYYVFYGDKTEYGYPVLKEAYSRSFEVLTEGFAKDEYSIFSEGGYYGGVIRNGNPKTFKVLTTKNKRSLAIDKDNLYRCVLGCSSLKIDSETFEILDDDGFFLKDKNQVIFTGTSLKILSDIDSQTFEFLDYSFSKDKNNIYSTYFDGTKRLEEADIKTFKVLKDGYAKDENNCYKKDYQKTDVVDMSECEKISNN